MRTWLKDLRVEAGLKQEEVANLAGIHRTAYGHIETGERNPTVMTAKRIAQVLDVEWTLFFEDARYDSKNKDCIGVK